MIIRCDLCGGDNELLPGQKVVKCNYCGSSLAVEEGHSEHLILPHNRDDGIAEDMLGSYLLRRGYSPPREFKTEFSYVPFSVIEDDSGGNSCIPSRCAPSVVNPLADIPAGDYSFFDRELASGEKIVSSGGRDSRASREIHIPIYIISFRLEGKRSRAVVIGGGWQVQMERVPVRKENSLEISTLLPAAGLFVIYLLIGKLGGSWMGRFTFIAAASLAAWAAYRIREKVTAGNER